MTRSGLRRVSPGYTISLALSLLSFPFDGMALGGLSLLKRGQDPVAALDSPGLICLAAAYLPAFLVRLVFWRRSSPALREGVRTFVVIVLCALLALTTYTVVRTTLSSGVPGWMVAFVILAFLCQIATLAWLIRYRNEPAADAE